MSGLQRMTVTVDAGPHAGKRIAVGEGQRVTIGRATASDVVLDRDPRLSGRHCSVALDGGICRVVDCGSANGTFVNDQLIADAVLHDGDRIRAGATTLVVHFGMTESHEEPAKASPRRLVPHSSDEEATRAFSVGSWSFPMIPDGWVTVDGVGLQWTGEDGPATVVATEDTLQEGITLESYIAVQMQIMERMLLRPRFDRAAIAGDESHEAISLMVRSESSDGQPVVQRQHYARYNRHIAVLTFTRLEDTNSEFDRAFDRIQCDARFCQQD